VGVEGGLGLAPAQGDPTEKVKIFFEKRPILGKNAQFFLEKSKTYSFKRIS